MIKKELEKVKWHKEDNLSDIKSRRSKIAIKIAWLISLMNIKSTHKYLYLGINSKIKINW